MLQLLWIETLLKLVFGLVLATVPLTAARLFGLSRPDSGFWPRLLGGVLIGLAGATFLEGWIKNAHGLGLGGCLIINLAAAAILFALLVLGKATDLRRGRLLLWGIVILLIVLSLLEVAHV